MSIRDELLGVWKLVHTVATNADGEPNYPFGDDAIGYIYYSEKGIMAVQICRLEHGSEPSKKDYLAYFGTYEVDEGRKVIKHLLEGQMSTGQYSHVEERHYVLKDDLLSLRPESHPDHEILWRKV